MKLLILQEEDGSEENAPHGLEIHCEIRGVGSEPLEEMNIPGMGQSRAEEREDEQAGPISFPWQLEMTGLKKRKAQARRDPRSGHAKDEHGGRINPTGYQLSIQHGKDGMKKSSQQANEEAQMILFFKSSCDQDHSADDNGSTEDLPGTNSPALNKRFRN